VIAHGHVRLRRAEPEDAGFVEALLADAEVEPFLAPLEPGAIRGEIDRSLAEQDEFGRFLIEVEEQGEWRPAGLVGFELRNRRCRIAFLQRLAVDPSFRGRRLADTAARLLQRHLLVDLGYHRLELEVYGFNERAIAHAERAGFVREGVKRRAYLHEGEWVDGVLFGLLRDDFVENSGCSGHGAGLQ
jgi:RimJ/RimL family protein N-acetyltransferase